jgi:monoamine oxidase
LEPFIMVNYNAYVHSSQYFAGKPMRFREVQADFQGHVAELLAKCTQSDKLDQNVSKEDQEILLEALRSWGGLDKNFAYGASSASAERRGYQINKGGGLMPAPLPSTPVGLDDLLRSDMWMALTFGQTHYWQSTIFQPVGGMDQTPKAIARHLADITTLNRKVVSIRQDAHGVAVTSVDARNGRERRDSHADWCVCTLPLTVLGQIEMQVGDKMKAGIDAVAYSNGVKSGLQFKRRFWEEDDGIFGGISFTDLPIGQIAYPNFGYNKPGKGVLLGCFAHGVGGYELEALGPKARLQRILDYGAQIHPQYRTEFENGITVNWHRVPFTLGCGAAWTPELRAAHYKNLAEIDGRIVLAGDHISELTTWQEGSILSALDAIGRLHHRILAA